MFDTDLEPKDPGGRPTSYTSEIADKILMSIAVDELSLRQACQLHGVAPGTFCGWVVDDRDKLSERYMRARRIRAHGMVDEMIDIADDGSNDWEEREGKDGKTYEAVNREVVQRSALRVSARQWALSRILRNEFGDKIELGGKVGLDVSGARDGLAAALGGEDPATAQEDAPAPGAEPAK